MWGKHVENSTTLDNKDLRVGVLGFGVMGRAAAEALAAHGYQASSRNDCKGCSIYLDADASFGLSFRVTSPLMMMAAVCTSNGDSCTLPHTLQGCLP